VKSTIRIGVVIVIVVVVLVIVVVILVVVVGIETINRQHALGTTILRGGLGGALHEG
jgi:hypothetical protein